MHFQSIIELKGNEGKEVKLPSNLEIHPTLRNQSRPAGDHLRKQWVGAEHNIPHLVLPLMTPYQGWHSIF